MKKSGSSKTAQCKFGGNSFFIKKGDRAVILIHGFTATTQEMERLAVFLSAKNYTVIAPLLKGHNTSAKDLATTTVDDYFKSVLDAYHKVKKYTSVDVIGISVGALLALHLSKVKKIRKTIILAPALHYRSFAVHFLPILQFYKGEVAKSIDYNPHTNTTSIWDLNTIPGQERRLAYTFYLAPQLHTIRKFAKIVRKELPEIKNPILVMHSLLDLTTHPKSSSEIHEKVGSSQKKLIWLKKSGHIITEDVEEKQVWREIANFIKSD